MLMMLAQEAHAFALGLLGFTFRSAESGEIHDQSIHPPQLIEMAPGPDPNSVGDGAKRDEATTKVPSKDPKKKDDKKEEDLRKKQTNYMVWAAPAAVVVLMLLDLGNYYVF
ncbi:hypothetical protein DY000_02004234 [Brassica cretica]|uniref:Transmembrane protein n=1 Tax=Brassica cretica TaxID=69181 RepID=A0ABQ7CHY5_BRACR|nr:hypothetical protein DY000_02004234 [Brassica cretica]